MGDVVMERGHLLGLRVPRPDSLWAAKVGNAGVRRDAGAGEHEDAASRRDPAADGLDRVHQVRVGMPAPRTSSSIAFTTSAASQLAQWPAPSIRRKSTSG